MIQLSRETQVLTMGNRRPSRDGGVLTNALPNSFISGCRSQEVQRLVVMSSRRRLQEVMSQC
jgi:hypothetical protein